MDNDDDITVTTVIDRLHEHIRARQKHWTAQHKKTQTRGIRAMSNIHFEMPLWEIAKDAIFAIYTRTYARLTMRTGAGILDPEETGVVMSGQESITPHLSARGHCG